ncbi:biotin/lipoyl-containing protein, partial [Burkholderia sp. SIMBA_062]|uniref:biotin/lipoyl-containing protein n=1 Tax=Burkholderia sp. SIMBA_062 TaxID=3085803 RepID=UPI00397955BF
DVIEVNVKPGDVIEKEQTLITLESDKASMEVPSDVAGTVKEVKVKAGEKVSQGTVIAIVDAAAGAAAPAKAPEAAKPAAAAPAPAAAAPAPAPQAGSYSGAADIECDMLVLGAGPGGYSAAFRSA